MEICSAVGYESSESQGFSSRLRLCFLRELGIDKDSRVNVAQFGFTLFVLDCKLLYFLLSITVSSWHIGTKGFSISL